MSCPHCGGMIAAELAAVMDALVCEKTVFERAYCHCNDVEHSMWACWLPEETAFAAEPPNAAGYLNENNCERNTIDESEPKGIHKDTAYEGRSEEEDNYNE